MLSRRNRSLRHLVVSLAAVTIVAAACTSDTTTSMVSSAPASTNATSGSSESSLPTTPLEPAVPNPFTIVDRFEAPSLGLERPVALAVGPDGNAYVTDTNQAVVVISSGGKVLRRWGHEGSEPGEFSFVGVDEADPVDIHASIAVGPDGKVYVSDSGNYRVEVFSAKGTFIRQFGEFGSAEGQLLTPFDLVADRAGNAYVVDDQAGAVSKFSPTGAFVWRIGGFAEDDTDLLGHEHLGSIDSHGRVVMTNDDTAKVLYVDDEGHKVDSFDLREGACDVAVDAVGNTFVNYGCGGPADTEVFDRTHDLVAGWYGDSPMRTAPRLGMNGQAFALGADGTILKLRVTLP